MDQFEWVQHGTTMKRLGNVVDTLLKDFSLGVRAMANPEEVQFLRTGGGSIFVVISTGAKLTQRMESRNGTESCGR